MLGETLPAVAHANYHVGARIDSSNEVGNQGRPVLSIRVNSHDAVKSASACSRKTGIESCVVPAIHRMAHNVGTGSRGKFSSPVGGSVVDQDWASEWRHRVDHARNGALLVERRN